VSQEKETGQRAKRTSKRKGELEKRHSGASTGTVAMVHDFNVGVPATKFRVDDDKTDGPIRSNAQNHQQENPGDESGLTHGVGKT
jgi:hypothetical protein